MRCLPLLFALLAYASDAQAAQLRGAVIDPSGRPIPKASVDIRNTQNEQMWSGQSDALGKFTTSLPNGRYRVHVAFNGFADKILPVTVTGRDQAFKIPLALQKQSVSVVVSSGTPTLDTSTDAHQDLISLGASDLQELPIEDGDVLSAILSFTNPAGGQAPTIFIDGMERTDDITLNSKEIQRVNINNNAYSAEFPKPGKDRIEIDTAAGDDTWHGGLTVRARNSAVNARNPLAPDNPAFSRYGYEASLSGPILRKKLYIFASADREQQQQVNPVVADTPSGFVQESVLAPFTRNLVNGRLDWQITQAQRATARYEFHQDTAGNVGVGGFVLPEAGVSRFHHDYRIELSHQYALSANVLNNFRMALGTNYERASSQSDAPSVIVNGAFQQGSAQQNHWRREPRYEFHDTFSAVHGSFTWKAGVEANLHPFRDYSQDNFGGTYEFDSLAAYQAHQPLLYTVNLGTPLLVSQQNDYAWFLQVEKKFARASVFVGVRHEFQSHFDHYGNLAPRLSAAFAMDKSRQTILRVGAGVFYDRRPPVILQQSEWFNGINVLQYVLENPLAEIGAPPVSLTAQQTTRYPIDSAMTFPRLYQASATLERQLPAGLLFTLDYTYQRGTHLFLTRNINAPLPDTGNRPNPLLGNIDQIESSASSRGSLVNITLKSPGQR